PPVSDTLSLHDALPIFGYFRGPEPGCLRPNGVPPRKEMSRFIVASGVGSRFYIEPPFSRGHHNSDFWYGSAGRISDSPEDASIKDRKSTRLNSSHAATS